MKLFFDPTEPYPLHIIGKCPNTHWPIPNLSEAWNFFEDMLSGFARDGDIRTHAFVMMRNHYHWIASTKTPKENRDIVFAFYHSVMNFEATDKYGVPDIFHTPPKIIELDHIEAFRQAYAYVYRNPVTAGLVDRAEHYPYSTLPYVLGRTPKKLKFTCVDTMNLIYHPNGLLAFINSGGVKSNSCNFVPYKAQ